MAVVIEEKASRVGTSRGSTGYAYPRRFYIQVDRPTDDPAFTLQRTVGGVPYLSRHPWNPNTVADEYILLQTMSSTQHRIQVNYVTPTDLNDPLAGLPRSWTIRIRASDVTRKRLEEVGPNPRIVGPSKYDYPGPGEAATHYANVNGKWLNLIRRAEREPIGYEEFIPGLHVTLERDHPGLTFFRMAQAAFFKRTVNSRPFLLADPGFAMVLDMEFDPIPRDTVRPSGGRIEPRLAGSVPYHGTLHFLVAAVDLRHDEHVNVFTSQTGSIVPVRVSPNDDADAVREKFVVKREADPFELLGLFA